MLPSLAANSIHVMKMSNAFAQQDCRTQLVAFRSLKRVKTKHALRSMYGVSENFKMVLLPNAPKIINRKYIAWGGLLSSRLAQSEYVYTRVPEAASLCARMGLRTCLELHHTLEHSPSEERAVRDFLVSSARPLLVTISKALKERIIEDLCCDEDRVFVAHDAADAFDSTVQPALPRIPGGKIRVGYLGHLYKGKGMELIEKIASAVPWAEFEIIGGTEADISYWRKRLGTITNIHFYGFVDHARTPGFLKCFDVALLPNQDHVGVSGNGTINISRWTSPLKAFEYMSAGLPIIASDQPNLREIFEDGVTALLCQPNQPDEWIHALYRLREDKKLRFQLGNRAKISFENRFTWSMRAKRLLMFLSAGSVKKVNA